jgi:WD40 repeat protein
MFSANVSGSNQTKTSLLSHVTWSPDDRLIAACFGDKNPQIIEPKTKQVIRELVVSTPDQPRSDLNIEELGGYIAAWSPDGQQIAIGRHRMVHIFNVAAGKLSSTHSIRINPATAEESLNLFSADPVLSRLPPIGTREQQIERIDKYIKTVSAGLSTLRWDLSGISIGTAVGAYRLDLVNGSKKMSLKPNPCPGLVKSPVVSPNGKYLAGLFIPDVDVLGDLFWNFNRALNVGRRVLQIWNIESGAIEVQYQGDDLPDWKNCRLYWSADSQRLAWGHDNNLILFEIFKNASRIVARSQEDNIKYLAWHPVYNHLAVHDSTDGIVVYDTATGVRRSAHRDAFWGKVKDTGERVFAWSNAGDALAVGGIQCSIDVWRVS